MKNEKMYLIINLLYNAILIYSLKKNFNKKSQKRGKK